MSFDNERFKDFISDMYPKELTISETTESTFVFSRLAVYWRQEQQPKQTI